MRRALSLAVGVAVFATGGVAMAETVRGTAQSDTLVGTPRADHLSGLAGHDELYGGHGPDRLDGGVGIDHIWGGGGDDVIVGGPAVDLAPWRWERLFGGAGDDVIVLRVARAVVTGGSGDDHIDVRDPQNDCRRRMHPPQDPHAERTLDPPPCVNIVNTGPGDNFVRADDGSLDSISCLGRRDRVVIDQYDSVAPECTVLRRVKR